MFNKYAIPKEMALDKLGGVDDAGEYKSPFRDPSKRFGASLGALSGGYYFYWYHAPLSSFMTFLRPWSKRWSGDRVRGLLLECGPKESC